MILVFALVVFGPRRLPEIARSLGRALGQLRGATADFRATVEREVGTDEIRQPLDDIRALAREMAAGRTMLGISWSLQRAEHGEQSYWMITLLAAMLGQFGLPGGGVAYGYGSVHNIGFAGRRQPASGQAPTASGFAPPGGLLGSAQGAGRARGPVLRGHDAAP